MMERKESTKEEMNKRAIAIGSNLGGKVKDGGRIALVYSTLSS